MARGAAKGEAESDTTYESEPVLVPPGKYCAKLRATTYGAVDYLGQRFHIGEHVALHTGEGREWVCVIEVIYECPVKTNAMFKGRWFWSPDDVREHQAGRGDKMRASRNEAHELISSDNRDANPVEVIARKCVILSWQNFCRVRRRVTRIRGTWKGVYFCDRMYYHKAFRFRDLSEVMFPGDPIPKDLLKEIGVKDEDVEEIDEELAGHPGYEIGGGVEDPENDVGESSNRAATTVFI